MSGPPVINCTHSFYVHTLHTLRYNDNGIMQLIQGVNRTTRLKWNFKTI